MMFGGPTIRTETCPLLELMVAISSALMSLLIRASGKYTFTQSVYSSPLAVTQNNL